MYVEGTHLEQLLRRGYFTLESILEPRMLARLRAECDKWLSAIDTRMERAGQEVDWLTNRGKRYFIEGYYKQSPAMLEFVHSPLIAEIGTKVLGPNVYLFVEQFVVKMPRTGTEFAWHQDSGYIPYPHKPYLTCWAALDDMTEANGTLYMLPYGPEGMPDVIAHRHDETTGEDVGYSGPEPGIPVIVPAGSLVVFSSRVHHRSGPNHSDRPRRAYLPQLSCEPIMSADGSSIRNLADPLVLDGKPVARPAPESSARSLASAGGLSGEIGRD